MTSAAIAVVLASAVLHALWNAMLKRTGAPRVATPIAIGWALLGASALVLFDAARSPEGVKALRLPLVWAAVLGLSEAGYFVCLARSMEHGGLGHAYPISRALSVLLIWPASMLWLSETASVSSIGAAGLVALGLLAQAAPTGRGGEATTSTRWALGAGVFIALYNLAYKKALAADGTASLLFAVGMAVSFVVNLTSLGPNERLQARALARTRFVWLALTGAVCTGSFVLLLSALKVSGAARVLTFRNLSVVIAQVFAVALGERVTRRQWTAAALVAGGAVWLGLSH